MKQEVKSLSLKLSKTPNDVNMRHAFFQAKKRYKKQLKLARAQYKQGVAQELENAALNNPKLY